MSGSTDVSSNYEITKQNWTLTVIKAKTATTWSCNSLTYNWSAQTLAGGGNYVNYTNNSGTDATWYTVTVTADGNHQFSDGTESKTLSCSIAKKSIGVTWWTVTWTYDGNAHSTTATAATSVAGESMTLSISNNSITNVGTQEVTASCSSVSGWQWKCTNYSLTSTTNTLTVNKAAATCPTLTAYSGVYDGNSHTITVGTNAVWWTIQYRTSPSGSWSNTNPSATNVSSTTVYVQVLGDSNHTTKDCGSSTLTITKKWVTVKARDQSKTYDGSALTADGTCDVTSGSLVVGHSVTCTSAWSQTDAWSSTKTLSTVVIKNSGNTDVSSNYDIKKENWTLTVIQAKTATTGSCNSLTYNGGAQTLAAWGSYVSYSNNSQTDAWTYNVTVTSDGNHQFSDGAESKTLSCSIAKKSIGVTWWTVTWTYDGSEHWTTAEAATAVNGETMTLSISNNAITDKGTKSVTASCSSVSGWQWKCANYSLTSTTNTLTVNARPITVKARDQSKTYDGSALTADGTCDVTSGSLVVGHSVTCTSAWSQTNAWSSTKTLSTVVIKNSGNTEVSSNYDITKTNWTLTVNKAEPTHVVSGTGLTYNGSEQTLWTVTTNGWGVTYSATQNGTYSATAPKQTNAWTYTTYYKIAESTNYKAYSGSFSTTIAQKAVTITLANQTTNYPTVKEYTFTSDGDGTFTVTSSDTSVATVTNNGKTITLTPKKVWSATITVTHTAKTSGWNYKWWSNTFTFTVNSGAISVTTTNGTYTYDGNGHPAWTIAVTEPTDGYTIKYGTTAWTYSLNSMPIYTEVWIYTTYYEITATNYNSKTWSITTTINDETDPTCGTWSYSPALNSCTTWNVTATLANSTDVWAWILTWWWTCTINAYNGTCSVTISDKAWNTKSCTSSGATNIDRTAPDVTVTNANGYECSRITWSVSATDPTPKCGTTLQYSWANGSYEAATSYGLSQNDKWSQSVTVKVKDAAWNETTETVTYTWVDVALEANDFTWSTNVWNSAKTANWLTWSAATAWSCETITATLKTQGSKWSCEVNGNNITYSPSSNYEWDDECTITLADGDGTKDVIVSWKGIDTTLPTCTITQAACTSGNLVLTLAASEAISTPDGWTSSSSTVFTKNVTANGTVSVNITDTVGNVWSCSTWVTNYDKTWPNAPTLKATTTPTNNTTPTLSWNTVASDNGCSTVAWYEVRVCTDSLCNTATRSTTIDSSTTTWDVSSALPDTEWTTYYWKIRTKDALGNRWNRSSAWSFYLDTVAPSKPTFTLPYVNGWWSHTNWNWTNKQINSIISTTESNTVTNIQYKIWNWSRSNIHSSLSHNWTKWTGVEGWTISDGRNDTVLFRAIDEAGNISESSDIMYVKYDTTAPTCLISKNPTWWTSGNVVLSVAVTELHPDKYSWTWWDNLVTTTWTWTMTGNGDKTFYVKDAAGNTWSCSTWVTNIDNTAPTWWTFTINNDDTYTSWTSVTLTTTCPSDAWQWTVQVAYGNSANPDNWTTCSASISHTLTAWDWTKTVYMRFRDGLGNTTSDITDTIILDTTAPNPNQWHGAALPAYINSGSTIEVPLDITEAIWMNTGSSNFDVNDIHIYVWWVEKYPTKTLTYDSLNNWVYTYNLTLTNLTGDGVLKVVLPVWSFTDNAWNPNSVLEWNNLTTVDNTFPTITITQNNASTCQLSKTITATTSEWTLTMSEWTSTTCNASRTFTTYASKTYNAEADNGKYICYRAVDWAWNTTYKLSAKVQKIDRTAPTLSSKTTYNNTWYNANQTSTFTYTDACAWISGSNTTSCTIQTESSTATCTTTNTNVCDILWNCNTTNQTSNSIKLDKTRPSITFDQQSGAAAKSHSVEITATDTLSKLVQGSDGYTVTYNGKSYTVALSDLPWTYYWWNNTAWDSTSYIWLQYNDQWWWWSDNASNWYNPNPTNYDERQWPCDDGWHVPSRWERNAIITAWCHLDTNDCTESDLEHADDWTADNGLIYINNSILVTEFKRDFWMMDGDYWSSSPHPNADYYAWYLNLINDIRWPDLYYSRNYSNRVRCVKNDTSAWWSSVWWSSTLKYKWQTSSQCSSNESDYTSTSRDSYDASNTTATATVTTDGLADGSYYLCVLSWSISDNAWNTNVTAKTSGQFTVDNTAPAATLTTTSGTNQTSQTATLSCTDGVGVTSYYRWTTAPTQSSTYTTVSSTTNFSTTKSVTNNGTYYLACKDSAGNVSDVKSITYVKYQVKNMLDTLTWNANTYNTTNYAVDTTKPTASTYSSLTLANLCTAPTTASTLQITSVWDPGTTAATNVTTASAANQTYACWYARTLYDLTLTKNTWIATLYYKVNGASSFASTWTSATVKMKAWSDASVYAVASNCYTCASTCKNESSPQTYSTITADQTYAPTATENTNNITYNMNWWTNNANNPSSYKITQLPITLQQPTRVWYTFKWWTGSNGNTPQTGVTIAAWSCGAKTYNATWQANTYKISYNLSGWTHGTTHPTTVTYDSGFTVSNPTREWYTFSWWKITWMNAWVTHTYGNQTTTSTTISSTKATWFNNLNSNSGATVTFEALWTINQYNVTILINEEGWGTLYWDVPAQWKYWTTIFPDNNLINFMGYCSNTSSEPSPNPSPNPYQVQWSDISLCGSVYAAPTESDAQYTYEFSWWNNECGDVVTHDCTITAEFTRTLNSYNVTFNSNGWTPTPAIQNIAYGSKATKPADPTRTGYTFAGWTLNGNDFDFNTTITWAITLVAKWVDDIKPTFTVSNTSVNEWEFLTINISASDNGTGLHAQAYKCGNENWKATASCYMWFGFEPTAGTILIQVRDKAGNTTWMTVNYEWKNVAPTANNVNGSNTESKQVTLTVDVSDPGDDNPILQCVDDCWTTFTYKWYTDSSCSTQISNATSATYNAPAQDEPTSIIYYYKTFDAQWSGSNCASATATWTNTAPVNVNITNNGSTWECKPITYTASATDTWATFNYQWYAWANCTNAISSATSSTYTHTLNNTWSYSLYVKVTDGQWSWTCSAVNTATWTDVVVTGHNFVWHANVWNTWKTVNWLTWSAASAWSCETITATVKTPASHGTCSINGNNITYSPSSNYEWDDECTITLADGDGTKDITVSWKNIDTTGPIVQPDHSAATSGYVNSWDTVEIPLNVTEAKWINTSEFNANDVHVYVWSVEVTPTKTLNYDSQVWSTYQYTLILTNLPWDGDLKIIVPAWSFTDNAWNQNIELTWTSHVIVDNIIPTCWITQDPLASQQTNGNVTLTVNYVEELNQISNWYSWNGTTFNSTNTKPVSANETYTAYVKDAADNVWSCNITVNNIDTTAPQIELTSSSDQKSATQRLTWTCTDNVWITQYYIWSSSTPSYVNVSNVGNFTTWINITSAWTYYFFCKDAAWNVTSGSKTYHSYTVHNMLETITWTSWSYNTNNYTEASSATYIAPTQTSLTLSSIYTIPTYASGDTYRWYSTSNSVSTLNTSATTTLNGNSTYYTWFDRQRYYLDLIVNTWIAMIYYKVNGATTYTSTQSTIQNIVVKAWSQITGYATPKAGYTYNNTSSTNPWTVASVSSYNVFSPVASANTNTQYKVYHYVKIAWENGYALSKTETLSWTTDAPLTLVNLSKASEFMCANYDRWSLTWTTSWPWPVVTETTIKWDGSTEIYLYYLRSYHTVILSGDEHVEMLKIGWEVREEASRECGNEVPVEAIPKPWYHFVRWEERSRKTDNEWETEWVED